MAPTSSTPARKKRERERENNFFDVGVQGRKTGITLRDAGVRDEHGMMPIEGIFSSPMKSPVRANGNGSVAKAHEQGATSTSAREMSSRRVSRNRKTTIPPPIGRSPIKTSIGSSPRRPPSMGPPSHHKSPDQSIRVSSRLSVNRKLLFNQDDPQPSIELSPPKRLPAHLRDSSAASSSSPSGTRKRTFGQTLENDHGVHGVETAQMTRDAADGQKGAATNGEPSTKKKKGRPRKSDEENAEHYDNDESLALVTGQGSRRESRRSRAAHAGFPSDLIDPTLMGEGPAPTFEDAPQEEWQRPASDQVSEPEDRQGSEDEATTRRRSRSQPETNLSKKPEAKPVAVAKMKANRGPGRPSGRPKGSSAANPPPTKKRATSRARSQSAATEGSEAESATASPSKPGRRPRSLQILRQGTPSEEAGAQTTRYGRASIKPVDWWRGERVDRERDGTIQGVIRAEDVKLPKRAARGRARGAQKRALAAVKEEEEEEEAREDWERDPGILTGFVAGWDEERAVGDEEDEREEELAFASSALSTTDVVGSNFRYTKCLSMPFFGSGIVDLPAGGFKRTKNSRRMQLTFFVHYGKVTVRVGDSEFAITKGGTWQVPRGNLYSIENHTDKPARLFFAQGCAMAPPEEAGDAAAAD